MEISVHQVGFGPIGAVEVSWRAVLHAAAYRLHYDEDLPGEPYTGKGLSWVRWTLGCVAPDAGRSSSSNGADGSAGDASALDSQPALDRGAETGAPDSRPLDARPSDLRSTDLLWPGTRTDSPIEIPAEWCLDTENTFKDAGVIHVETPGMRPRVRVQGLAAGRTYYLAVQAARGSSQGAISAPAAVIVREEQAR